MNKEEYYKRIEKINNRFKTDRVGAYEEYQLVCQRNYLSTKYIEHLEQQCKKQQEVIDKTRKFLKDEGQKQYNIHDNYRGKWYSPNELDILNKILEDKEVSEWNH